MTIYTKLIFGIRTSGSVQVTFKTVGQLPAQPPDLLIRTSGQSKETTIACSNNVWFATLAAGDHVVRMEATDDSWFDQAVNFDLSAPSTIIVPASATQPQPGIWIAQSGAVSDPKNPWPPPLTAGPVGTLDDQTWVGSTLDALKSQIMLREPPGPGVLPRKVAR